MGLEGRTVGEFAEERGADPLDVFLLSCRREVVAMRCLVISALAFMLSLPVAAQDFQKGLEAYERGDYATALQVLRPLAKQGDAPAQYNLAVFYHNGQGVP